MTSLEKASKRKAKSLKFLVDDGEFSVGYALRELERLHDEGKIIDADYEPLAEYFEELLEQPVIEEEVEVVGEDYEEM